MNGLIEELKATRNKKGQKVESNSIKPKFPSRAIYLDLNELLLRDLSKLIMRYLGWTIFDIVALMENLMSAQWNENESNFLTVLDEKKNSTQKFLKIHSFQRFTSKHYSRDLPRGNEVYPNCNGDMYPHSRCEKSKDDWLHAIAVQIDAADHQFEIHFFRCWRSCSNIQHMCMLSPGRNETKRIWLRNERNSFQIEATLTSNFDAEIELNNYCPEEM